MPRRQVLYCEMCGAPIEGEPYVVYIEGTEMYVCERCYYRLMSRSGGRGADEMLPLKARVGSGGETSQPIVRRSSVSVKPAPVTARRSTRPRAASVVASAARRSADRLAERYEVVPDYAERVRRARERLGMSQEELAIRVKEKVNVIKRIEAGTLVPPVDLARRLEKVLGIKLLEPVVDEESVGVGGGGRRREEPELTLGDIVEIREE